MAPAAPERPVAEIRSATRKITRCAPRYLSALHIKDHLRKEMTGTNTLSHLANTTGTAQLPSECVMHADGLLRFGDCVAIGSAMGGLVAANAVHRMDLMQEAYQVTKL